MVKSQLSSKTASSASADKGLTCSQTSGGQNRIRSMTQRLLIALGCSLGLLVSPVLAEINQPSSAESQEHLSDWERRELARQQRKRMEARRCISDWRLGLCSRSYR